MGIRGRPTCSSAHILRMATLASRLVGTARSLLAESWECPAISGGEGGGRKPREPPTRSSRRTDCTPVRIPSWSPDGTTVAFTSNRSGSDQVWAANANGTNRRSLTPITQGEHPAYYDGTTIAFASDRSGTDEIWAMHPDGTNLRQLTSTTPNGQPDRVPALLPTTTTTTSTSTRFRRHRGPVSLSYSADVSTD